MTLKRNLITGLTIGTAVFTASLAHADEEQTNQKLYVSGIPSNTSLNIRDIETNEVIDIVKGGDIVTKLGDVQFKQGWVIVKTEKGIKGMCNSKYLSTNPSTNQKNIKVTSSEIELRTGAGNIYRIHKFVPANTEVEFISTVNDWAKVKYNGRILYCPKYYLVDKDSSKNTIETQNAISNTNNTSNISNTNNEEKIFTSSASVTTLKSSANSVKNAKIALDKIDGMVIKPGEKFSYLNSIGPIDESNGYVESTVIKNGKKDKGIGGGVCLSSTTVFNAMIEAGIEPLQRRNHSLATAYKERGLDAMVATGSSDLSFINNTGKTLTIKTSVKNGLATVSFVSKGDHKNGYTFRPRVEVYNNNLSAKTYLQKLKNGVVVSEKLISKSNYLK